MAVATPTMLPVPMVPARAVHMLWNWLIAISSFAVCAVTSRLVKIAPTVCRSQYPIRRNWKNPVRMLIHKPVPNSSARPNGPHTTPLTALFSCVIHCTIRSFPPVHKNKTGSTCPAGGPARKDPKSFSFSPPGTHRSGGTPLCAKYHALSFCLRDTAAFLQPYTFGTRTSGLLQSAAAATAATYLFSSFCTHSCA